MRELFSNLKRRVVSVALAGVLAVSGLTGVIAPILAPAAGATSGFCTTGTAVAFTSTGFANWTQNGSGQPTSSTTWTGSQTGTHVTVTTTAKSQSTTHTTTYSAEKFGNTWKYSTDGIHYSTNVPNGVNVYATYYLYGTEFGSVDIVTSTTYTNTAVSSSDWLASAATGYHITAAQVKYNGNGNSWQDVTTPSDITNPKNNGQTQYIDQAQYCVVASDVTAPSGLHNVAPLNNGSLNASGVLDWSDASDVTAPILYTLQVSTSSSFPNNSSTHTYSLTAPVSQDALSNLGITFTNGTSYYWHVKATDSAPSANSTYYTGGVSGDTSSSSASAWEFTYDTTAPTVTLNTPANLATIHGTQSVTATIGADAVSYSVAIDGTNVVTDQATPYSAYAWNTVAAGDGSHTVTVSAKDAAGNSASDTHTVTVDNTAPVVTVFPPSHSLTTADTTPEIVGTVDDPSATISVAAHGHTYPTVPSSTPNAGGTYDWAVVIPAGDALTTGTYPIVATATDAVGNSSTGTGTLTIDTTAPTTPWIITPHFDSYTNDHSVPISWTTSYTSHLPLTYTLQVATDSSFNHKVVNTTTTSHSYNTWLPDGKYWVRVEATNGLNVASNWSSVDSFTVDTVRPHVHIQSPANGLQTTDNTLTLKGSVYDLNPEQYSWTVINNFTHHVAFSSTHHSAYVSTQTTSHLPDGSYTVVLTAVDKAGNWSMRSVDVTIDTHAPILSLSALPSIAGGTTSPIAITGSASDKHLANYELVITNSSSDVVYDSNIVAQTTSGAIAEYDWDVSAATSGLPSGIYTISLTAYDSFGNYDTTTTTVTIDNTAPVVTATSYTGTSTTPAITGTTDGASDVVTVNGTAVTVSTAPNSDGTYDWSYTFAAQTLGTHAVTVTSTDSLGNVSTITPTLTINAVPTPAAPTDNTPGNGDSDTTGTPDTTTPEVLGTQTQNNNDKGSTDVKGASTQHKSGNNAGDILGLAWYWWLLILLVLAGLAWWLIGAWRRRQDDTAGSN